jgi:hypothetical protein
VSYDLELDFALGARALIDFWTERGMVVGYRVVLLAGTPNGWETIRVHDSAHGFNEMHRYAQAGGKQTGTRFHSGTLGEGLNAAINETKSGYAVMIEGWRNERS